MSKYYNLYDWKPFWYIVLHGNMKMKDIDTWIYSSLHHYHIICWGILPHAKCQFLQHFFFYHSNVYTMITSGTLASWYWLLSQNSTTYWSIIYSDTYIANIYYQSEDIGNEEYYARLVIPPSVCTVLEKVETASMENTKYQIQRITWWKLNGTLG